jgi:lysozyme
MKNINKILIGAGVGLTAYYVYRFMISQKMSLEGMDFLMNREGFKNKAYQDSKGKWTIGVGHLIKQPSENYLMTKTLSNTEVMNLLKQDLPIYESAVNDAIMFPLPKNKFDALVSLAFNIGPTAFKNSTLAKRINSKLTDNDIIKAFLMWSDGGTLINRRALEARLFTANNYNDFMSPTDLFKYINIG